MVTSVHMPAQEWACQRSQCERCHDEQASRHRLREPPILQRGGFDGKEREHIRPTQRQKQIVCDRPNEIRPRLMVTRHIRDRQLIRRTEIEWRGETHHVIGEQRHHHNQCGYQHGQRRTQRMQHGADTPMLTGSEHAITQLFGNRTNLRPEQRKRGERHHHKRRTTTHICGNAHRTGSQTRQR